MGVVRGQGVGAAIFTESAPSWCQNTQFRDNWFSTEHVVKITGLFKEGAICALVTVYTTGGKNFVYPFSTILIYDFYQQKNL